MEKLPARLARARKAKARTDQPVQAPARPSTSLGNPTGRGAERWATKIPTALGTPQHPGNGHPVGSGPSTASQCLWAGPPILIRTMERCGDPDGGKGDTRGGATNHPVLVWQQLLVERLEVPILA